MSKLRDYMENIRNTWGEDAYNNITGPDGQWKIGAITAADLDAIEKRLTALERSFSQHQEANVQEFSEFSRQVYGKLAGKPAPAPDEPATRIELREWMKTHFSMHCLDDVVDEVWAIVAPIQPKPLPVVNDISQMRHSLAYQVLFGDFWLVRVWNEHEKKFFAPGFGWDAYTEIRGPIPVQTRGE